jgi:hypothetical protein
MRTDPYTATWIAAALIVALPGHAHAYLDPSTGSMVISALISLAVTVGFAVQSFGYRALAVARGLARGRRADAGPREATDSEPGAAGARGSRERGAPQS